jgi:hypothetical protein
MTAKPDFATLDTTIKGKAGEAIVKADLEAKGYIVYTPTPNIPEPFDFFVWRSDAAFLVDVKTYNRLATTPAISIDLPDLDKYIKVEQQLRLKLLLYWVCTFEQAIFASTLENFRNGWTKNHKTKKATIHLQYTTFVRSLTLDECREIGYPTAMYNGVSRWFTSWNIEKQALNRKWL